MFIHRSHLPQRLTAEAYHSPEQYELELREIFSRSWHYVGTTTSIPAIGDYFTANVLGRPLLVHHTEEGIRCFLNVCAHRFSLLTSKRFGRSDGIRCQYHGWEYDASGKTRKIPDAESFRPLRDNPLGLISYRLETCGQLIFICFATDAPNLAEYLGENYRHCGELFSEQSKPISTREFDCGANWKVKIENALESYHIDCVHPKTFVRRPAAEVCQHRLATHGTTFNTDDPPASRVQRLFDEFLYQIIGLERDRVYEQSIHYPNFMFGKAGVFSWIESVVPLEANRCRVAFTMFARRGSRRNPISLLTWRIFGYFGNRFAVRALREDLQIVPEVQQGLEAAVHPSEGLISIREERIFHFQEYILRAVSGESFDELSKSEA